MALTVIFALVSAFVLSFTFVPAMVALCIRGRVQEHENRVVSEAKRVYAPLLSLALARPRAVVAGATALFLASLLGFAKLGQEFVPTLSELDFLVQAIRIPSTSLSQSTQMQQAVERELASLPEVELAFSKTGTPEMASDPMPVNVSDGFVILKPRAQWPDPRQRKDALRERIEAKLAATQVGNNYEFTQPIQMRFNELIAGSRDVAASFRATSTCSAAAERIAGVARRPPEH